MAAVLGVLSVGGAVWLLVPAAVLLVLATRGRRIAPKIGGCLGAIVLLSIPTLLDAPSFLSAATEEAVRSSTVLGNLVRPLSSPQVLGCGRRATSGSTRRILRQRGSSWP
jgi:hypothetical protein